MAYCDWGKTSEENLRYHDTEWGVPLHDDRGQFEFLTLEVMQCGLNWELMIRKRGIFRQCFAGFDYDAVAGYGETDVDRIVNTPGMIRSVRKIRAVVNNARRVQAVRREFGTFSDYLWGFSGGRTILYDRHDEGLIPVSNGLSETVAADLRKRGFQYLGAVTVYSHLQACGIINDHGRDCPCYRRINSRCPTIRLPRDRETPIRGIDRL